MSNKIIGNKNVKENPFSGEIKTKDYYQKILGNISKKEKSDNQQKNKNKYIKVKDKKPIKKDIYVQKIQHEKSEKNKDKKTLHNLEEFLTIEKVS